MSYEIIKYIKIKDNKVLINYASNNVYPRTFEEAESFSLSKILKQQGQKALDIEILKAYEGGNFQRGNNKYTRALHILRHLSEYKNFNWRLEGLKRGKISKNRESPAFNALLKKALNSKLPKDKFIITKQYNGRKIYLYKVTKNRVQWLHDKEKAKIFNYEGDADSLKSYFYNSENWLTEKIT